MPIRLSQEPIEIEVPQLGKVLIRHLNLGDLVDIEKKILLLSEAERANEFTRIESIRLYK